MITTQQMKELEDYAETQGVSSLDLMENAGREVVAAVKRKYELDGKRIIIFCGTGNNAGDGFVAARYFAEDHENPVTVLFFGTKEKLKEEAKRNYEKIGWPITLVEIVSPEDLQLFHVQKNLGLVVVDALLGTGIKGELREPLAAAIDLFNQLSGVKVAVDIPSGVNPDTGEIPGKYCKADFIVTFHDLKVGLEKWWKKTVVVDIGIPPSVQEMK